MVKDLLRGLAFAGALWASSLGGNGSYAQTLPPVPTKADPFHGSPYLQCVRESMRSPLVTLDDILGAKRPSLTSIVSVPRVREAAKEHFEDLMSMAFRRVTHYLSESDSFIDTPRPNAVVIFPEADDSETFSSPPAIAWFSSVWREYDVYVKVAEDVGDLYDALDHVPDISLVVISGHGRRASIALDDAPDDAPAGAHPKKAVAREEIDDYDLTPKDKGLAHHLKNLKPGVVFFLNSCSTGKGGRIGPNMANFIGDILLKYAPFKRGVYKVIAPSEVLMESGINIRSVYPFDVLLMDGKKDITYVHQGMKGLIDK